VKFAIAWAHEHRSVATTREKGLLAGWPWMAEREPLGVALARELTAEALATLAQELQRKLLGGRVPGCGGGRIGG